MACLLKLSMGIETLKRTQNFELIYIDLSRLFCELSMIFFFKLKRHTYIYLSRL